MKSHICIILCLLFLCIHDTNARQFPKVNYSLSGVSFLNAPLPVEHNGELPVAPSELNTADKVTHYQNTVELIIQNHSDLDEDATVIVDADVTYYLINNITPVNTTIQLQVDFKTGALGKSDVSNLFAFINAYKISVNITNVTITGVQGADLNALKTKLQNFVELNITFQEERFTRITYNSTVTGLSACKDSQTDELVIKWNALSDAEEYELEYTFIDNYGENSIVLPISVLEFNFKENSTRIALKDRYYRLPLLFERGHILYRVRAIGRGGSTLSLPVYCMWSGPEKGFVNSFAKRYYHSTPHMADKMNWQVASTFAEDGKRSDVVNYFDGTFRSRQKVTGVNFEKKGGELQSTGTSTGVSDIIYEELHSIDRFSVDASVSDDEMTTRVSSDKQDNSALEKSEGQNPRSPEPDEDGKKQDIHQAQVQKPLLEKPILSNVLQKPGGCFVPESQKEREVIAGETIYDYQGRPAINILPAPTNSKKIRFIPRLNISDAIHSPANSKAPYHWKDFDKPGYNCTNTSRLSSHLYSGIMGAAAYYSSNNPNKVGFNAFIPDGAGFTFTQTSYVQDNTGKIAAQSGVGEIFRLGSGHETKYLYGSPDQEELDRMFGTEVGDAVRYQKNAIIDPNGQVSVSYVNPEGKTIATALAGINPQNLEALPSQTTNAVVVSLLNNNIVNTVERTITTEHQFTVTSDNSEYTFDYQISPEAFDTLLCGGNSVCMDCIYDIVITLNHNESCDNIPLFSYTGTIGDLLNNSGEVDVTCQTTPDFTRQIKKILSKGSYALTKKLTVNEAAAQAYQEKILRDTCQVVWQNFLTSEKSKIDTANCYSSCFDCVQPPIQNAECDTTYCAPNPNRCDLLRQMMIGDLSPGGQYAQFQRSSNGDVSAGSFPLSVFNPNHFLPNHTSVFTLLPNVIVNDYTNLVNNWLPEYAEALLPLHPEYCMLSWCDEPNINTSLDFDASILSTQYYLDAQNAGYLSGTASVYENLLNADPWFANGQNSGIRSAFLAKLANYGCTSGAGVAIDAFASHMAYCVSINPPQIQTNTPPATNLSAPPCTPPAAFLSSHIFGSDPALANLEWTFLRSLYLSAKNQFIQSSMSSYSSSQSSCNTNCMGTNTSLGWNHPPANLPCGPNEFIADMYQNKVRRFGSGLNSVFSSMQDAGLSVNLSGVTDIDDPCQYAAAVAAQSANINQQVATNICGSGGNSSGGTTCELVSGITTGLNLALRGLARDKMNTIPAAQLPVSVTGAGITGITVSTIQAPPSIEIKFQPECASFTIPYKKTPTGSVAPVSISGLSNIVCPPGNATCSFSIQVTYVDGTTATYQRKLDRCNYLHACADVQPSCTQASGYGPAIKEYLTRIFTYYNANGRYSDEKEPLHLISNLLAQQSNAPLQSVILRTEKNFEFEFLYQNDKRSCMLTLQENSAVGNWNNIRYITNILPDASQSRNGVTYAFILRVLIGDDDKYLKPAEVKGSSSCWPMTQCPPEVTFCDSMEILPEYPEVNNCVSTMLNTAYSNASQNYTDWMDTMRVSLLQRYYAKCLAPQEKLIKTYEDKQYHYTLYYYDQAGNLVKTVPPAGVILLDNAQTSQVALSRSSHYNTPVLPPHVKATRYIYNTLNQVIAQKTPDAGESNFYYDGLGRIVASQNAQQKQDGFVYSYTRYDKLGRINESGKLQTTAINQVTPALTRNFNNWTTYLNGQQNRSEITLTHYDAAYTTAIDQKFGSSHQRNLRNRVASIFSFDTKAKLATQDYSHATHYSYDIIGNVYKLIQDYPNTLLGDKVLEYDYDLQSGKVNSLTYQRGAQDQFIHKYSYDAMNRLVRVKTSPDGLNWDTDAEYFYYRHGSLARLELGTDKVQGLDYMYTLQGWIKGVNGTSVSASADMGQDAFTDPVTGSVPGYGDVHKNSARDAFGYVLDYYNSDYTAIQGNTCLGGMNQQAGTVQPLYNGNISRMYTQLQQLGNTGFNYSYDQLNRLISQQGWKLDNGSMQLLPVQTYAMKLKYDPDGNILSLDRNGTATMPDMDKLKYNYYTKSGGTYDPAVNVPSDATNKLAWVDDDLALSTNYPIANDEVIDIDDQSTNNYKYDLIGNLTSDVTEGIQQIEWNLQNKIKKSTKSSGATLSFQYDALGNRVMKEVSGVPADKEITTYYVRDAQGNTLAAYSLRLPRAADGTSIGNTRKLFWDEAHIYGSSRIGMYAPNKEILQLGSETSGTSINTRGYKQYELSNHLGNVLVTISDRKLLDTINSMISCNADLITATDYYAGGMVIPERNFNQTSNRYGYNQGSERDNEFGGIGNYFSTFYREGDTRLLTWLSRDPKANEQGWQSPYSYMDENSILFNDPKGDCPLCIIALIALLVGHNPPVIAPTVTPYNVDEMYKASNDRLIETLTLGAGSKAQAVIGGVSTLVETGSVSEALIDGGKELVPIPFAEKVVNKATTKTFGKTGLLKTTDMRTNAGKVGKEAANDLTTDKLKDPIADYTKSKINQTFAQGDFMYKTDNSSVKADNTRVQPPIIHTKVYKRIIIIKDQKAKFIQRR